MRALHLRKTETWSTNREAKQTRTASGKENPSLHAVSSSTSLQEETFPVCPTGAHLWQRHNSLRHKLLALLFSPFEQSPRVTCGTRPAADLINVAAETILVIEQKLAGRSLSRAQSKRTFRKTASDRQTQT